MAIEGGPTTGNPETKSKPRTRDAKQRILFADLKGANTSEAIRHRTMSDG